MLILVKRKPFSSRFIKGSTTSEGLTSTICKRSHREIHTAKSVFPKTIPIKLPTNTWTSKTPFRSGLGRTKYAGYAANLNGFCTTLMGWGVVGVLMCWCVNYLNPQVVLRSDPNLGVRACKGTPPLRLKTGGQEWPASPKGEAAGYF